MMTSSKLANECKSYQFILLTKEACPEYARARRGDLRQGTVPTIDTMSNELNDRRDDPVRTTYTMTKQKTDQQKYGTTTAAAAEATATVALDVAAAARETRITVLTPSTAAAATDRRPHNPKISLSALCAPSAITHVGAGDNCWYTYPKKATAE